MSGEMTTVEGNRHSCSGKESMKDLRTHVKGGWGRKEGRNQKCLVVVSIMRETIRVKARTRLQGFQCDQNVTCDKWQRNRVFGGGPWNKAR